MSNTDQPRGPKKQFNRTFGDVMKGIPAGKGGDRAERAERPRTDRPRDPRRAPREESKRVPVVVRKPAPLAAKPADAAPAAEAQVEAKPRPESRGPRSSPKTVFRRAEQVNLPPREALSSEALASVIDEPVEDFAAMFAESEKERPVGSARYEVGQKVSGTIVQIGSDTAFLDLGGKGEAMISLNELRDSEGNLLVAVGEILDGYVLSVSGGTVVVTKVLSKGAQREFLLDARESGIPVEGLVTGQNKGGLEVDLGGVRGFCPSSQADVRFADLAQFVGQRLQFLVTEVKDRDVVLSRRALLEQEAAAKAEETRRNLRVGAQLEGRVTSLRDFGAFVDLGGIEGLIHVSELGYGHIAHPKEVLEIGQTVKVEVVKIEGKPGDKSERIGLSMKALQQDPWDVAVGGLAEGQRVTGKVVRLQPFGAFVELLPGVDGLVHISALGANRRINHPKEVVSEGEEILVAIESIDRDNKRIGLRRITEDEVELPVATGEGAPAKPALRVGDVHEVTVDKIEPFGVFVSFPGGRALIPNVEMGTPKGTDHRRMFPAGTKFKASIIEINGDRIRMSKSGAEEAEERAEYQQFMREQRKGGGGGSGLGTLGDLLKAKLGK